MEGVGGGFSPSGNLGWGEREIRRGRTNAPAKAQCQVQKGKGTSNHFAEEVETDNTMLASSYRVAAHRS